MPKIKFSRLAYKERFCELCRRKLIREEAYLCKDCYSEINRGVKYD